MPVPREIRVERSIARFYQHPTRLGCVPNFRVCDIENGVFQFWRISDDGDDSEGGTSYIHHDGRIEFHGSLLADRDLWGARSAPFGQ